MWVFQSRVKDYLAKKKQSFGLKQKQSAMTAGLPKIMKNKIFLIILVIVVVLGLEALAMLSRPKVALKAIPLGETPQRSVPADRADRVEIEPLPDAEPILEPKQEAALNLELIGTAMGNCKDPIAFIKDLDSGKQGIYKLGSTIKEAKVIKIVMGQVVLNLNGTEKVLSLSKRQKQFAQNSEQSEPIVTLEQNQYLVNREEMLRQVGKVLDTVKALKVRPYQQAQQVCGLKVDNIPENSLFAAAGLQDNDVVTMVNSQKIDSYQKALQVLHKVKGQSEIQVSVLRNGEAKMLSYKIQ